MKQKKRAVACDLVYQWILSGNVCPFPSVAGGVVSELAGNLIFDTVGLDIRLDLWEGAHLTWNFLYCYFALSIAPHTHPLLWQLMTHVSLVAPCYPLRTFYMITVFPLPISL